MNTTDKFCLKWSQFAENISQSYKEMREESTFFDVTLACDDDFQIEAHKVVLSASSTFFKNVLKKNQHSHPLIYMKGFNRKSVEEIIDFMYYGEVNVDQEDLNGFLTVAQELKVKGLENKENYVNEPSALQKVKTDFVNMESEHEGYSFTAEDTIYSDKTITEMRTIDTLDEAEEFSHEGTIVNDMMERKDGLWVCTFCGKTSSLKRNLKRHTEIHLGAMAHPCTTCGKTYSSKNSLQKHKYTYHK